MNTKILTYSVEDIPEIVRTLHELLGFCKVMTFTGSLGAGKTTLVQELLRYEGVQDVIQSPTFNYVSIYTTPSGLRFYHFDLYRLPSTRDFMEAGFHEYLYEPNSYALIEWPEIIMPLLKKQVCHVALDYVNEDARSLRYACSK